MVVFSRSPVTSVIFLVMTFFTIACHYMLLNAQFLAAVHVIVYAGAIMVLFLYVIMLLNLNEEVEKQKTLLLRSEEHTSELQSRENLVCRLLLEKKKRIREVAR